MKDSNVKVGDKVKSLVDYAYVKKGEICRVVRVTKNSVGVESSRGFTPDIGWCLSNSQYDKIEQKSPTSIEQLLTKASKHAAKAKKHEQKREALIEQARQMLPEGYELNVLGEVVEAEPVEDMSDPKNWQAGDVVECIRNCGPYYTKGHNYTLMCWPSSGKAVHGEGDVTARDNDGDQYYAKASNFKWIIRPNKETK